MYSPPGQKDGASAAPSAQAKPQPLHSFDLPNLTWNSSKNVGGSDGHHHRQRRSSVNPPPRRPNSSPSHVRHSSLRDGPSYSPLRRTEDSPTTIRGGAIGGGSNQAKTLKKDRPRDGIYSDSQIDGAAKDKIQLKLGKNSEIKEEKSRGTTEKSRDSKIDCPKNRVFRQSENSLPIESKSKGTYTAEAAGAKKSKILIKFPGKKADEDDRPQAELKHDDGVDDDSGKKGNSSNVADEETKTWNLRPRKPMNISNRNSRAAQSPSTIPVENEGNGAEKRDKRKLSINLVLTKEEIEEDIFAMTGLRPARRPKTRARNMQKQLDYVFPGSWLAGINADYYKVSES